MGSTSVLLRLDEPEDHVQPTDAAGGLADLTVPSTLILPTVVDGIVGRGRQFDVGRGFRALEAVQHQTRLRRSMAIEAIVSTAGLAAANGTRTIVARGLGGAGAGRRLWGLQIVTTGAPGAPVYTLQMFWDSGGAAATVPGAVFVRRSDWLYVAASRRWISATEVEVDYFVNDLLIGTVTSTGGGIADGDDGYVTLGCRGDGAGAYENFWIDIIDQVRVSNRPRTPEEIEQTYRRIFVHQPRGYELVQSLLPPGEAYSRDPESAIQRELMVEGDVLGYAHGLAQELARDFLPDRATRTLDEWEKVTLLAPAPTDSIAQRRLRVVSFLRKVHGFNRDEIREALADILDQEQDDVTIVEYTNRFNDAFGGASIGASWYQDPNAGAIAQASGALTLSFDAGDDARWETGIRKAVAIRAPIHSAAEAELAAFLSTWTLPADGDGAGLFFFDGATDSAHLFGIRNKVGGAGYEFFRTLFVLGGGTPVVSAQGVPASDVLLRMKRNADGTVTCQYSLDEWWGPWNDVFTSASTIGNADFAGLFLSSASASPGSGGAAEFDEARIWTPKSRQPFRWYIYRDPGESGSPDVAGAQLVIDKMRPSHTQGQVIQSLAFLAGDPFSLAGRDPVGG